MPLIFGQVISATNFGIKLKACPVLGGHNINFFYFVIRQMATREASSFKIYHFDESIKHKY
jgi:hypothetical protein